VQHNALGKTEVGPVSEPERLEREVERQLEALLSDSPGLPDVHYFLICFPLDPVHLDKSSVLTLGRAKSNDIIFPVDMVSREHAEISWDGEAFEIRDLGSSNGTYVNRKPIERLRLKEGDEIKIGPYDLQLRTYRGRAEDFRVDTPDPERTQKVRVDEIFGESSTFAGQIGEVRMGEIIQLIDFNKKTGTLEVKSGDRVGAFHFKKGQLIHGEFHQTKGVLSVARILSLHEGQFGFQVGTPDCERTIFEPTSKVLLNALRRLDEMDR
jgi:pSer/pThr/pTyr-binding forkhead associated (FHA) protein